MSVVRHQILQSEVLNNINRRCNWESKRISAVSDDFIILLLFKQVSIMCLALINEPFIRWTNISVLLRRVGLPLSARASRPCAFFHGYTLLVQAASRTGSFALW